MRRELAKPVLILTVLVTVGVFSLILALGIRPALGLDLQGGISVTQQPVGEFSDASLDLAVERIRERVDSIGVAEPEILRQGDAIVVNLPGVEDQDEALRLVQVTGQVYLRPVLQCIAGPGPDDGSTTTTTTPGAGSPSTSTPADAPTTTAAAGPARSPSTPSTTPDTTTPDTTTDSSTDSTVESPTPAASPTTVAPAETLPNTPAPSDPTQSAVLPTRDGGFCSVGPAAGTGEVFEDNATPRIINGSWGVTVDLRSGAGGEDVWNAVALQCNTRSASCPSGQLAIELDGEILSAPTVDQAQFSGSVQISGAFTEQEARQLAQVLESGSLPVVLETQSVQNVSPTLGKDSLNAAIISGLFGVFLVLALLVGYYRHLGLIVVGGIAISSMILWSIISILSKTSGLALSLSGVAGIIVSVGVTVDSYVVFFERLKDEVRAGRTLRNSASRGFQGAWRTILLADIVSLIGAFVLWYLTVGSVRNFAFFLGLSTLIDLFVAYFFTQPAVLLLARTKWMEGRKVMGVDVAPAGGAA